MGSMSRLERFVMELPTSDFQDICHHLDVEFQYRQLAAAADNTRFQLDASQVEEFASALYQNKSPSAQLLIHWGKSMRVGELVVLLDKLRMERCMLRIRDYEPLRIDVQPAPTDVTEGENLELTCHAVGFPYPVYVWFRDDQQLSISTDGLLRINDVSVKHAGPYICRIHHDNHETGELTYLFSNACNVRIRPSPIPRTVNLGTVVEDGGVPIAIVRQPSNQTIQPSQPLRLVCQASGPDTLSYFWVKGGRLLSSAPTGPVYELANADVEDAGDYYCIVKNGFNELHSDVVNVTVKSAVVAGGSSEAPEILQQPADVTCCTGGVALFTIRAQYHLPLSHQWYFLSSVGLTKTIAGGTGAELRVPVNGIHNAGKYQCRVFASNGKETLSQSASLTVTVQRQTYTASDKLALLIGESTYRSHGIPLPAVKYDLHETEKVLRKMGYKVVSLIDLTLAEMNEAIAMFCDLLSKGVYAIFYCAGHGFISSDRRHYLIPWDAGHQMRTEESLCIESVESQIQAREPKLVVLLLDICRRSGGGISNGPTRQIETPTATPNKIILFAASEGQQAYEESKKVNSEPRGLFSRHLLEIIDKPLCVLDLYKAIMDRFKSLPYDRAHYPQHPAMYTNNEDYDRTLLDPIDQSLRTKTVERNDNIWHLSHILPSPFQLRIAKFCVLDIVFAQVVSNIMKMQVVTRLVPGVRVAVELLDECIPSEIRPVQRWQNPSGDTTVFYFANLQRLRSRLNVSFVVHLNFNVQGAISQHRVQTEPVDLGQPLIAVIGMGRRRQYDVDSAAAVAATHQQPGRAITNCVPNEEPSMASSTDLLAAFGSSSTAAGDDGVASGVDYSSRRDQHQLLPANVVDELCDEMSSLKSTG